MNKPIHGVSDEDIQKSINILKDPSTSKLKFDLAIMHLAQVIDYEKCSEDQFYSIEKSASANKWKCRNKISKLSNDIAGLLISKKIKSVSDLSMSVEIVENNDSLIVFDEDKIPDRFFFVPELTPSLDRVSIKDALRNGEDIPGARLSPSKTLTVREIVQGKVYKMRMK